MTLPELRKEYVSLWGKQPFGGWKEDELIKRIEEKKVTEKTPDGWEEDEEKKGRFPTATLKLYQKDTNSPKGVVIDYKHLRNDYDEATRKHDKDIYELTVLHEDKTTEKVEITLIDFARIRDIERVEIIESQEKTLSKVYGKVRRASRSREGYTMSQHPGTEEHASEGYVDEKVTMMETICKVRRPNGDVITINNNKLNA